MEELHTDSINGGHEASYGLGHVPGRGRTPTLVVHNQVYLSIITLSCLPPDIEEIGLECGVFSGLSRKVAASQLANLGWLQRLTLPSLHLPC
jgi:hypothetical protein